MEHPKRHMTKIIDLDAKPQCEREIRETAGRSNFAVRFLAERLIPDDEWMW